MSKVIKTDPHLDAREELAREIIEGWDMDNLMFFALAKMEEHLRGLTEEEFLLEYKIYHGEDVDE